ncbi:two-component sensor histidine kinase [Altericroceibacterium spongiae]|uniref:histidine kinase n=1 Tax=Altericroceibacterium spongiae TaxID=2320269 RepID=A0A420EPD0_9SPHN|nr:ATP-binding protein [Altericroceibacterium spongiae]RKF22524.1 two-component sensor histidine kinase [Altericroceibacterium spongiae]
MTRFLPKSLFGQVMLAIALALFLAQGLSAILLYRAQQQRQEALLINAVAFRLGSTLDDRRQEDRRRHRRRELAIERRMMPPIQPDETRQPGREAMLRNILADHGVTNVNIAVTERHPREDPFILEQLRQRPRLARRSDKWIDTPILVAAIRPQGTASPWAIVRMPIPQGSFWAIGGLLLNTVLLFIILVGGLAIVLRRITRPLAALTQRVDSFAETRALEGQLEPQGPQDMQRLILAHNRLEGRIAALLNEKDVMLGAIGHDLKTPLASLRVRIESVENSVERERMATTIEDITHTLDDILSLARVGRPTDPLEKTELGALTASVVEEYEDMGEPVTLGECERISLPIRATWLRRALRNLISNALRYGADAEISLCREKDEAVICIADHGPGIADADMDAMFQPFQRGDPSRNRGTGGAGLGLTLARAIAEQHGGQLALENRLDADGQICGLVAELRLPIHN